MKINNLKTVCVTGAGDMGHGIAQLALMNGYSVNLCDINYNLVNTGIFRIRKSLEKLMEKGQITISSVDTIMNNNLRSYMNISEAVSNADLIIEAVSEKLSIKETVLREIAEFAPHDAIIASNTSTMSITTLAQFTEKPENFIGMHFFNPPVLMKLVEVIKGEYTSEETVQFAFEYVRKLGKEMVYCMIDTPGFIANRITAPVIIYNGLCIDIEKIEPADIDATMMKNGIKMGPMELADYTSIDVMCHCLEYYQKHLSPEYQISDNAKEMMALGHFGKKSGQGYYTWQEGRRPKIDERSITGRYDPNIPFFIQANESCKLYESGVCSLEDCDKAIIYGYNMQGSIDYIQRFKPDKVADTLDQISKRFKKTIFRPTDTIRKGAYLR